MAAFTSAVRAFAIMYPILGLGTLTLAGSLADVEHVILFMQENRAFDHYFGTMAGVRGFSDPNVQVNPAGRPVWYQNVTPALSNASSYLLPWYLNYEGGDWLNATQCMIAGDNGWRDNHAALNGGLNDHWAVNNTPWSWGHFKRADIPVQFAIADGWTVGDMYQESVIASTNPNRVTWASGSINVPGSPQKPSEGGNPYIDNNETPGCESGGFNCYPVSWKTTPEFYQAAGVSWSIYQDADNFDDNPLAWFAQYQDAPASSPLYRYGMVGQSLDTFYAQAANGTLPAISYIIGPTELSEHPPYAPRDGAWLQKKIVDAVTKGKGWAQSVLLISYDETGGFGDHVTPYHSPAGTPGEWLADPYKIFGDVYAGPGFRLPFYMVSPWTRGGKVFAERADHNSQILFVERWLAAKGKNVTTDQMVAWRRAHMSDLVAAFDFEHPDYSLPALPDAPPPHVDANGVYDGSSHCEALYAVRRPPVPYGVQDGNVAALSEKGFKGVRGRLTEGRFLTFEAGGFALANGGGDDVVAAKALAAHDDIQQRWVVHYLNGDDDGVDQFVISSAKDGRYIGSHTSLVDHVSGAETYTVGFVASKGYALQKENGKYLAIGGNGDVIIADEVPYFDAFSVT